jgi:hypothetical protein
MIPVHHAVGSELAAARNSKATPAQTIENFPRSERASARKSRRHSLTGLTCEFDEYSQIRRKGLLLVLEHRSLFLES